MAGESENIKQEKIKKIEELRAKGINPFPYSFDTDSKICEIISEYDGKLKPETKTDERVKIAGRITSIRGMGAVIFADLQDQAGKIQLYFKKDDLKDFEAVKGLDIGDIVGIEGKIFTTKSGQLSIAVDSCELLTKSLTGIADSYYGIKDIELKYRNRSLDLITNQESKDVFIKRFEITKAIRNFMDCGGFLEVETPINQITYGGAAAKPFITYHEKLDLKMYLRVSPEQYLKRLLVGGLEAVYEIGKSFRNENIDRTHNPEFTMLEAYIAYKDYNFMMDMAERLIEHVLKQTIGKTKIVYESVEIDFSRPWKRLSVAGALKEIADIDVEKMSDEELIQKAKETKKQLNRETRGEAIMILFEEYCEEKLIQPTHIIDYPKESTVFCKIHRDNPDLIERFESYVAGKEITNGYSELNDPVLQRQLLESQAELKEGGAEETWGEVDEDFLSAMDIGMPPAAGIGIGIDRLCMIILDQPSIRDVLFFPTMKPEGAKKTDSNMLAVAVLNEDANLSGWQKLNTVAHLSASFAGRKGQTLFSKDQIMTKDAKPISLNVKNAIVVKETKLKDLIDLISTARKEGLEYFGFTSEMLESTNDNKIAESTASKNENEIEFLGVLIYGDRPAIEEITKPYKLIQ